MNNLYVYKVNYHGTCIGVDNWLRNAIEIDSKGRIVDVPSIAPLVRAMFEFGQILKDEPQYISFIDLPSMDTENHHYGIFIMTENGHYLCVRDAMPHLGEPLPDTRKDMVVDTLQATTGVTLVPGVKSLDRITVEKTTVVGSVAEQTIETSETFLMKE